jgi:alpha-1,2-mannosyltransferase
VTTSVELLDVRPVRRPRPWWAATAEAVGQRKVAAAYWLLGGSVLVWLVALQPWHWYMGDLIVYRAGASAFLHHHALYAMRSSRHHLPFTYPPIASVVLTPLAVITLAAAKALLSLLSAFALVIGVYLVLRRLGEERQPLGRATLPIALAAAMWLEPVRATFDFGQINLLLMALVLVDILGIRRDSRSGFLIGLAAAIKLTPLAFIPYLFLIGRRRSAVNAISSFVVCIGVGFAAYPSASATYWGHALFLHAQRVGRAENASNQSIRGIVARGLGTSHVPVWWIALAVVVFGAGMAASVVLYRNGRTVWSVTAMSITTLCVSPISWSHHWAWCAVMLPVCWDLARRTRHWLYTAAAVAVIVPFAAGLTFWAPHSHHAELADSLLQQVVSATYVLAGVLLVAVLSARAISGDARLSGTPSS